MPDFVFDSLEGDSPQEQAIPAQATTGEVIGSELDQDWNALPTVQTFGLLNRIIHDNAAPTDPENLTDYQAPAQNVPMVSGEDATTMAKNSGAAGLKFTAPISQYSAQAIIDDHVRAQQNADIIARRGNSILTGGVARLGVDMLVALCMPGSAR